MIQWELLPFHVTPTCESSRQECMCSSCAWPKQSFTVCMQWTCSTVGRSEDICHYDHLNRVINIKMPYLLIALWIRYITHTPSQCSGRTMHNLRTSAVSKCLYCTWCRHLHIVPHYYGCSFGIDYVQMMNTCSLLPWGPTDTDSLQEELSTLRAGHSAQHGELQSFLSACRHTRIHSLQPIMADTIDSG